MNDDNPTDDLNPIDPDDLEEVDEEEDGLVTPAPISEEDDHESLDALADEEEEEEMDYDDDEVNQF